jgi:hypothetical protein
MPRDFWRSWSRAAVLASSAAAWGVLAEREVAGAGEAIELGLGEQMRGTVVLVDATELGVGVGECVFAVGSAAKHGVGLGGVQMAEAGEGVTAAGGRRGSRFGQRATGERVVLAVHGDVAVAKEAVRDGDGIAGSTRRGDGLLEVHARGRVVAALGGVPHELTHEHRGVGLAGVELALDGAGQARIAERGDRAQMLAGGREQRRGRRVAVGAVERAEVCADFVEAGQLSARQLAVRRGSRGQRLACELGGRLDDRSRWADGTVLPRTQCSGGQVGSADGAAEQGRELTRAEAAALVVLRLGDAGA